MNKFISDWIQARKKIKELMEELESAKDRRRLAEESERRMREGMSSEIRKRIEEYKDEYAADINSSFKEKMRR